MSLPLIALAAGLQPVAPISLCGIEAPTLPAFFAMLDQAAKARTMVHMEEKGLHIYHLDERAAAMPRTRIWMATSDKDRAHPAIACYDFHYGTDGLEMAQDFRCDGEAAACAALAERLRVKKDPS